MPLVAGSVTVNDDETVTGSDFALVLYAAETAHIELPTPPTLGSTAPPYSVDRPVAQDDIDRIKAERLRVKRAIALRLNTTAVAVINYFNAHYP